MDLTENSSTSENQRWVVWGNKCSKAQVVFFIQVILIYIVAITSIVNLTLQQEQGHLWTALLSSSLGYLLPAPKLKFNKNGNQQQ
jgi:hypothetical protein